MYKRKYTRTILIAQIITWCACTCSVSAADLNWIGKVDYGLLAVDYLQTRQIVKHPERWREKNHWLGEHPSMAKVNRYFVGQFAVHWLVNTYTPTTFKNGWNIYILVDRSKAVINNYNVGIRIGGKF